MTSMEQRIPNTYLGWPTRFELHDPRASDAEKHGRRPAALRIEVHDLDRWAHAWLGVRAVSELGWRAWLGVPEHVLIEVTAGYVYRDDVGALTALRQRLAYFPRDVWLYKLASQ